MKISLEKYKELPGPSQCYRCQRPGHSATYCTSTPKCRKCAQDHHSRECNKPKNQAAKCINCGGSHPSNYMGCPLFKNITKNRNYRKTTLTTTKPTQQTETQGNVDTFNPRYNFSQPKIQPSQKPRMFHKSEKMSYANMVKNNKHQNTNPELINSLPQILEEINKLTNSKFTKWPTHFVK